MTQVVLVAPGGAAPELEQGVLELLTEVDEEFLPRLSDRQDTASLRIEPDLGAAGLSAYLDAMRRESWLVASDRGRVVGLLSFALRHDDGALAAYSPSLYVSTVAVSRPARHRGVATRLYDDLSRAAVGQDVRYLTTRTWETNTEHIRVLQGRGFVVVALVPGDRPDGAATVHFGRNLQHCPTKASADAGSAAADCG